MDEPPPAAPPSGQVEAVVARVPSRGSAPMPLLFAGKRPCSYVILGMALSALSICRMIERSRMGYALAAIRENEDAAEASGVNALAIKRSFGPAVPIQGLLPVIVGGIRR